MGKVKKERKKLHEQIAQEHVVQPSRKGGKDRQKGDGEANFVDEKLSKKILAQAKKQGEDLLQTSDETEWPSLSNTSSARPKTTRLGGASVNVKGDSDSEEEEDVTKHLFENFSSLEKTVADINEEDEEDLKRFMNPNPKERRTLADIIAKNWQREEQQ